MPNKECTLDMTSARKTLCSLHPEGEDKIWVTKRGKKIFAIVSSEWLENVLKLFGECGVTDEK